MAEGREKKVTIDENDSSNPLVLQKYTKLLNHIKKTGGHNDSPYQTEANLVSLVTQLRECMESLSGKDSPKPRPITKLPMSVFDDFSVGGALNTILNCLLNEAAKVKCSPSSLLSDSKKASEMLVSIDKELVKQGQLKRPCVFLNKVPVGKLNQLSKIVLDHGGSMASSEEHATHVIDWNEDVDSAPDSADDFIRILEVKGPTDAIKLPTGAFPAAGGAALVHWWYYPDSYNEWIPDSEISAGDSPDLTSLTAPTRDKWYVCCRFILDCDVFNEWGNPHDYENENNEAMGAEEVALEQLSAAAGAQDMVTGAGDESPRDRSSAKKSRNRKRFSQLAVSSYDKDRQLSRGAPVIGALSGTEKLQPDAIPPSLKKDGPAQVLEMSAIASDSKLSATEAIKPEVGVKRSASDAQLDAAVAECVLPTGSSEPSWFQQSTASSFEIDILGATCTSDAADYIKVRNGIIALCCQSPLQYITATECRRKLPGDVSKILQIHEFLNAFGLINSRARREARPDVPVSLLLASSAAGKVDGPRDGDARNNDHWTHKEDTKLIKVIEKSRTEFGKSGSSAGTSSIDWKAVAALMQQTGKDGCTAADCAARFVELQLPTSSKSEPSSLAGDDSTGARDLAAQVRNITKTLQNHPDLIASCGDAAASVTREVVSAELQRSQRVLDSLASEFVKTKLLVLEERVALLQGVDTVFEVERARVEADKRELQILRAQLALLQQSLLPADPAAAIV